MTPFSGQQVQIRVAIRDAELFSLSLGCTQRPHWTQCQWRAASCAALGAHYHTIPCSSDEQCSGLGSCGNVFASCANASGERVCLVESGGEPGALCGWY